MCVCVSVRQINMESLKLPPGQESTQSDETCSAERTPYFRLSKLKSGEKHNETWRKKPNTAAVGRPDKSKQASE